MRYFSNAKAKVILDILVNKIIMALTICSQIIISLCICISNWLRTPPLTEPEENALSTLPTVRMMGTVDFHAPSDSAL